MNNRNFNDEYKYDSCTSRGQCSLNPKTTALQEITLTRLKTASYYALKLYDNNDLDRLSRM